MSLKTNSMSWQAKPKSINAFFNRLNPHAVPPSSDPIEVFSSSPGGDRTLSVPFPPSSSATTVVDTSFERDANAEDDLPMPSSSAPTSALAPPIPTFAVASGSDSRSRTKNDPFSLAADSDSDEAEPAHPSMLVDLVRKETNAKEALARKKEYLNRTNKVLGQAPLIRKSVLAQQVDDDDDDDDDLEIIPPPNSTLSTSKSASASISLKTKPSSSFLDTTVGAIVKRPGLPTRNTAPELLRKRPLLASSSSSSKPTQKKPDLLQQMNDNVLKRAEAQSAKLRAEKEADWIRRGGKLKESGALSGPNLNEIMQQATAARGDDDDAQGANLEDSDAEDEDYQPHAQKAESDDDNDDKMGSGSEGDVDEVESTLNADGETTTIPKVLSQSTTDTGTINSLSTNSLPSLLQDPKLSAMSDSSPPSSRSSSDTEMVGGSQVTRKPRRSGKPRKSIRRVILDDDEEGENNENAPAIPAQSPDSDAENTRPNMDDSDLENMAPPAVIQQEVTDSDEHRSDTPQQSPSSVGGKRSPLKRLTSFSSLSFSLSSPRRGEDPFGGGLGGGEKSPFGTSIQRKGLIGTSSSPCSPSAGNFGAPLSELDGGGMGESLAETEDADADFGLGGMSQLFGAGGTQTQTQRTQQSQRQLVSHPYLQPI